MIEALDCYRGVIMFGNDNRGIRINELERKVFALSKDLYELRNKLHEEQASKTLYRCEGWSSIPPTRPHSYQVPLKDAVEQILLHLGLDFYIEPAKGEKFLLKPKTKKSK